MLFFLVLDIPEAGRVVDTLRLPPSPPSSSSSFSFSGWSSKRTLDLSDSEERVASPEADFRAFLFSDLSSFSFSFSFSLSLGVLGVAGRARVDGEEATAGAAAFDFVRPPEVDKGVLGADGEETEVDGEGEGGGGLRVDPPDAALVETDRDAFSMGTEEERGVEGAEGRGEGEVEFGAEMDVFGVEALRSAPFGGAADWIAPTKATRLSLIPWPDLADTSKHFTLFLLPHIDT